MTPNTKEVTVGALVFAVFIAVMIYLYAAPAQVRSSAETLRVSANFNRVDGLAAGDPVYLSGVRVGTVENMRVNNEFRAIVDLAIERWLELPTDSFAAIHTDGLFGSKFIVLEPGIEEQLLGDGDQITFTQDAVIVTDLLDLIIAQGRANREQAGNAN